jgi:hypothetical protein
MATIPAPPRDDHCPFLALPPEIRLRIYDYLYNHLRQCTLEQENQIKCYQFDNCAGAANLLMTCRQLHNEVLPIVYTMTIFKITVFGNRTPENGYQQFLVPRDSRKILRHVRRLEVVVHILEIGDLDRAIEKVIAISRQIPQDKKLETCLVRLAYHPDMFGQDPYRLMKVLSEVTFEKIRNLDRRAGLSVAEREVSSCLKNEAIRVARKYAQDT